MTDKTYKHQPLKVYQHDQHNWHRIKSMEGEIKADEKFSKILDTILFPSITKISCCRKLFIQRLNKQTPRNIDGMASNKRGTIQLLVTPSVQVLCVEARSSVKHKEHKPVL